MVEKIKSERGIPSPLALSPCRFGSKFFYKKGVEQGGAPQSAKNSPVGSEPSAAGGRYSEVREWQRSKKSRTSVRAKIFSGTATGCRNQPGFSAEKSGAPP